jgi:hypothetical protein
MPGFSSLRANPVYPGEGFREGGRRERMGEEEEREGKHKRRVYF